MPKSPKKVSAGKAPANVCTVTMKWFGDNGKPYGFGRRGDGTDVHFGRAVIEAAQEAGILPGLPRSGDVMDIVFDDDVRASSLSKS